MTYKNLEIVALNHDIPEYRLKKGDTGTVVDVYEHGEAYEVEFMTDDGETVALLTLNSTDISQIVEISFTDFKSQKSDRSFQPSGSSPLTYNNSLNTYNAYI